MTFEEYSHNFNCALLFATQGYRFPLFKNVILPRYASIISNDPYLKKAITRIIIVPNNLDGVSIMEYNMLAAQYKGMVDIEIIIGNNNYKVFNKFIPYTNKYKTQSEYILYVDDDRICDAKRIKSLIKANYILTNDGYNVPVSSYSYYSDGSGVIPNQCIKLLNCAQLYTPCFCCVLFPPNYYNTVFDKDKVYGVLNEHQKNGINIRNEELYFGYIGLTENLPFAIDFIDFNIVDFWGYNDLFGKNKTVASTNSDIPGEFYWGLSMKAMKRNDVFIRNYGTCHENLSATYDIDSTIIHHMEDMPVKRESILISDDKYMYEMLRTDPKFLSASQRKFNYNNLVL